LLWLGKLKNGDSCLFSSLPAEIFIMILKEVELALDCRDVTQKIFGTRVFVPWQRFMRILSKSWNVEQSGVAKLRFILERDGTVSLSNWKRFSDWFSFQGNQSKRTWSYQEVMNIVQHNWFFGFMDALEAKKFLQDRPVGSFLVRFSATPGWFVLSVNQRRVIHWRISAEKTAKEAQYVLDTRVYRGIHELLEHHALGKEPLCVHASVCEHCGECYLSNPSDRTEYLRDVNRGNSAATME